MVAVPVSERTGSAPGTGVVVRAWQHVLGLSVRRPAASGSLISVIV